MNTPSAPVNWPNLALLLLSLIVLAGVGYEGWQAGRSMAQPSESGSLQPAASTPTPLARLNLNNPHQRQGDAIEGDPSKLGKQNPFQ